MENVYSFSVRHGAGRVRKVQEARDIQQDVRLSEKMGEIRDSLTELKRGVEQVRDRLEKRP